MFFSMLNCVLVKAVLYLAFCWVTCTLVDIIHGKFQAHNCDYHEATVKLTSYTIQVSCWNNHFAQHKHALLRYTHEYGVCFPVNSTPFIVCEADHQSERAHSCSIAHGHRSAIHIHWFLNRCQVDLDEKFDHHTTKEKCTQNVFFFTRLARKRLTGWSHSFMTANTASLKLSMIVINLVDNKMIKRCLHGHPSKEKYSYITESWMSLT